MSTLRLPERPIRRTARAALRRLDALAGPNGVDPFLAHLDATWSGHEVRGRIVAVIHPTADSVTLTVRPNGGWTGFRAGQHVQVAVEIDGVWHRRCFSPSTSEHRTDTFDLTVKAHPGGVVSRHLKDHARPGDVLGLGLPTGDFTLPPAPHRPRSLLFVSGGSGFTPLLAMARTLADEHHPGLVTWLHYDRSPDEVAHRADVEALHARLPGLRFIEAHTRAPSTGDLAGHLDGTHLAHADRDWRNRSAWACGPPSLLAALREAFGAAEALDRLHTEAFLLTPASGDQVIGGTVTLRASGRELIDDGRPLLLQAESAGLQPDHGCRMGICRTCTTPLLAGTVRDVVTGSTTTASPADPAGCGVRLCVSAPVGDVQLAL